MTEKGISKAGSISSRNMPHWESGARMNGPPGCSYHSQVTS